MMHEKQTEANEVCQGLKSINEQLIHTLETERKDFDSRHQQLLAEVENARREAQRALEIQAGAQKEAEEAAYHAHVVALETDKGLSHLHAELEGLRKTVRDFEVRDSVISGDHERVLRDAAAQEGRAQAQESAKQEALAKLQEKECLCIGMKGELTLMAHKYSVLQDAAAQSADAAADAETELEKTERQLAATKEKLEAVTHLAEECMARAESGEQELQKLRERVLIAEQAAVDYERKLAQQETQIEQLQDAQAARFAEVHCCLLHSLCVCSLLLSLSGK